MYISELQKALRKMDSNMDVNEAQIKPYLHYGTVAKGEHIKGDLKSFSLGYLVNGCLRIYSKHENGKECSIDFIGEGEFFGCGSFTSSAVLDSFQAIANSEYLLIHSNDSGLPEAFMKLKERFIERSLRKVQSRVSSLLLKKPDVRYQEFLVNYGYLLQFIPDYYIAAYIGVSSVHLSRLKKMLSQE